MPVRLRIPLPGPFVYVPRRRHHRARSLASIKASIAFTVIAVTILFVILAVVTLAGCSSVTTHGRFLPPHPIAASPVALSTDPGQALYTYLHAHGATMPPSWAQVVDNRHASACAEFAVDYTDYPTGYVDEFGVDATLAHAAVLATGFCP